MHLLHSVTDVSSVRYSWMQRKAQLQANSASLRAWTCGQLDWRESGNHRQRKSCAPLGTLGKPQSSAVLCTQARLRLSWRCLNFGCSLNRNMTKHYTIIPPIWPIPVEISGKKRSWWTIAWQTKLLLNSERDTFGECLFAPLFTAWTLIHLHQGTSIAHFAQDLQHCDVVMVCTVSWQGVQHMLPAGHTDTLQGSLVAGIFRQMDLNDRHSERLRIRDFDYSTSYATFGTEA